MSKLYSLNYLDWMKSIADYYGYNAQSDILLEEMSELQKEILKKRRGADNRKEIVNEIADVQIMLKQMIHLLHITDDEIAIATRNKLSRQLSRIRKDKKQKAIEREERKRENESKKTELSVLDCLKHPYIEYEDENGYVINNYYWNEFSEDLRVSITYLEWDGTFIEENNPILGKMKRKNYVERWHSGSATKPMTLDEIRTILNILIEADIAKENTNGKE